MYSTCLFCHEKLGGNEVIEHFPVGRRLAFDAARGRLWVVCRACERWNLSPLEERWEAVEECERVFRDSRLRVSTPNIGLARLRGGLELVRVGQPLRPEMAAWRYGDQFGRRRRRALLLAGAGLAAVGAAVAGGAAVGIGVANGVYYVPKLAWRIVRGSPDAVIGQLQGTEGESHIVRRKDLEGVTLVSAGDDRAVRLLIRRERHLPTLIYSGDEALRAARQLLPAINRYGASRREVAHAVGLLEESRDPLRCFAAAARTHPSGVRVDKLPQSLRLALEMAAHEETERRALEGELAELERAWREAEEVAAIADSLLFPAPLERWLERLRQRPAGA